MDISAFVSLGRFKDIVFTLLKYGFEDMVDRLDLPLKGIAEKLPTTDLKIGTYERIRLACEHLGPTFVKFGQILSLRPDLLPAGLILELEKLQDEVPPVEFTKIQAVIEKSIEKPLKDIFMVFDTDPIAAASLSQVHQAVLSDGTPVAVKVQRPKIRSLIETDLNILSAFAARLHDQFEDLKIYDFPNLVEVSRRSLMRELDFIREARHMQIAKANLDGIPEVYIPAVYQKYCRENLLVMELIRGERMSDYHITNEDESLRLAQSGLKIGIKQIFEDGFFHADPHPGNILIMENHVLSMIDWGAVGRLTQTDRYEMIEAIQAVVEKDSKRLMEAILSIAIHEGAKLNQNSLERDLLDIIDAYTAIAVKDVNLGSLLLDVTYLMKKYHLRMPPDLAIMIKAFISVEGTARRLYPKLDIITEAEPHIRAIATQRFTPEALWRRFRSAVSRLFSFKNKIPQRISHIVDKIDEGELSIRFQHLNLEGLQQTLENISNRLTFGIIIASMIIGSSMIITTGVKPFLFGFPAFGVIGYIISGILGLWLVFNIIRNRRL